MSSKEEKPKLILNRDINKERWTDEKTKRFITLYGELPVLWDVSNPLYTQRSKKQEAFNSLQKEFSLTLNEVRNKIRIYRTTYAQELRKMSTNSDYQPKLAWFQILHDAFSNGTIKSFVKTPKKEPREIIIEYTDTGEEMNEEGNHEYTIKRVKNDPNTVIITEMDTEFETIDEPIEDSIKQDYSSADNSHQEEDDLQQSSSSFSSKPTSSLSSNELFLNSLLSTFEKLPDDKNMRARIKIQEILYKIAYDIDS